jgi:anti-sigma B factor antagonist
MIITTQQTADGITRLHVAGEIDMATVAELVTAMTAAIITDATAAVLVDFTEVTFCDSSGIAALDHAYFEAGQRAVTFRLANPQPAVRRVLKITGLLDRLTGQ